MIALLVSLAACTGDKEETGTGPEVKGCPTYSGFKAAGQTWRYSMPAEWEAGYGADIRWDYTLTTLDDDYNWVVDYTVLMFPGTTSESETTGTQTGVCDDTGIGLLSDVYTFVDSSSHASTSASYVYDAPVHYMVHDLDGSSRWQENVVGTATIDEDTTALQATWRYHVEDTHTWALQVGTFDTFEVKADEGGGEHQVWYTPDVGWVYADDNYEIELDAYTVPE